jgi:hypothetical protein
MYAKAATPQTKLRPLLRMDPSAILLAPPAFVT